MGITFTFSFAFISKFLFLCKVFCWKSFQRIKTCYLRFKLCGSDQIRSVPQSCPTLWDPMNHSTPGHPVHHQLLEFTETHVHRVSDAIQPSHPLWSPSPLAPNPSQHQSLFQWVNSLFICVCVHQCMYRYTYTREMDRRRKGRELGKFVKKTTLESNRKPSRGE